MLPSMPSRLHVACWAGLLAARLAAAETAPTIAGEADRWLAASRRAPAGNADLAGPRHDAEHLLESAKADLASGRQWVAFEELARGRSLLRALALSDENPAAGTDAKAFDRLWQERGAALIAEQRALRATPWGDVPGAVRAIAESAEGKIGTLVEASRAFAAVTSPGDGLFYLGQAQAAAELARLARSMQWPETPRETSAEKLSGAPSHRSILPDLRALQAKVNAAFQPPRSIELHSEFIRLSATLKLAQELDAAELDSGALYQYLDAVLQFSTLAAPAPPTTTDPAVWRERLAGRGDTTVGELFLQRADAIREAPAQTQKPGDARAAQLIAEQVLPAFVSILDRGAGVTPSTEQAASVTVTLVRWPYT
jgi:hypothetical protein